MRMSNQTYDLMKRLITVISPAFIALLTALNSYWNWGLPIEAITGSISAVMAFLGVCLNISSDKYKKGE